MKKCNSRRKERGKDGEIREEGRRSLGKGVRMTQTQILKGSYRAVPRTELDCDITLFLSMSLIRACRALIGPEPWW